MFYRIIIIILQQLKRDLKWQKVIKIIKVKEENIVDQTVGTKDKIKYQIHIYIVPAYCYI